MGALFTLPARMKCLPALSVVLWLTAASAATAEELNIGGLTLHVDKIESVDDGHVSATVRGITALVARESLQEFVLSKWLADPAAVSSLPLDGLVALFERSLSEHLGGRAAATLRALATHAGSSPELVRKCLSELGEDAAAQAVVEPSVESTAGLRDELAAVLAVWEASLNPVWVKTHGSRFFYLHQALVVEAAKDRFVELMRAGKHQQAAALAALLGDLYGVSEPVHRQFLAVLSRAAELSTAAGAADLEKLYPLADLAASDELASRALEPLMLTLMHDAAGKAVAAGNPRQAAAILARLKPEWRTPTTLALATRALDGLVRQEGNGLDQPLLQGFFRALSEHDEPMRAKFEQGVELLFDAAVRDGRVTEAKEVLRQLIPLRPQDLTRNDRERGRLAVLLAKAGRFGEASEELKAVQTSIRWRDRAGLFLHGYYIDLLWVILVFGIPVFSASFYVALDARRRERAIREAQARASAEADTMAGLRGFHGHGTPTGEYALNPALAEYTKSLALLGLRPGATLHDIKSAYRNAVKDVHPDTQQEGAGKASENFIRLTGAYDRALELRKKLKIED